MTRAEYQQALEELTDAEFESFRNDVPGGFETRELYVRDFVSHPKYEPRICHLLDLKTEAEKTVEANCRAAEAAEGSARSAKWATVCSAIGVVIALAALAVSILVAVFRNGE